MTTDTTNPKDLLGITKPQLNLVPPAFKIWVAKAMEDGAEKYGPYNWRTQKVKVTIYIAAAMRHLDSFLDGEDLAKDSKIHHAAHAGACLAIILDALECNCLIDDRPPKGCAAQLIERVTFKGAPAAPAALGKAVFDAPEAVAPQFDPRSIQFPVYTPIPKKKVYLAGPMRGIKDFNFPAFFAAEETLQALGYDVFNPARRDEEKYGKALKSETGDENEITRTAGFCIRDALEADCAWITRHAEAIVVLPGWQDSRGAAAEVALGRAFGLQIFMLRDLGLEVIP